MTTADIDTASAALDRFDGAAALAAYEALDGAADLPRVRAGRVRALWQLRRWAEARAELAGLLADHPDTVDAQLARGLVALGQPDDPVMLCVYGASAHRDDAEALAAFDAALALDPDSVPAAAGRAAALRMAGRDLKSTRLNSSHVE